MEHHFDGRSGTRVPFGGQSVPGTNSNVAVVVVVGCGLLLHLEPSTHMILKHLVEDGSGLKECFCSKIFVWDPKVN